MKNLKKFLACIAILAIAATAYAQYDTGYELFRGFLHSRILIVDETATIATVAATDLTVATSSTNNGIEIMPSTDISVTSPTVTVTAVGARLISITTDETQTGLIINGGTVGQILTIRGTSDSNTMRIDDGTSYTLAGNLVLGLGDMGTFRCIEAGDPASRWEEISRSEN